MGGTGGDSSNDARTPAFASHAEADAAFKTKNSKRVAATKNGTCLLGRVMIFMFFPLLMGCAGLYMGYLESLRSPEKKLSFDHDFVVPFLLALAMSVVVGFQTKGFTKKKVEPIIAWPKVRRVKKVIHKRNGKVVSNPHATEEVDQDPISKKKN